LADLGFALQGVFEMLQQFDRPEFGADVTFWQQARGGSANMVDAKTLWAMK